MKIKSDLFNLDSGAYVVTGGLGFLGFAHCKAIAAFGGTPIAIDLSLKNYYSLKEQIKDEYDVDLLAYETDISSKDSLTKTAQLIQDKYTIRGLVNNAARNPVVDTKGLKNTSRLENFKLEEWEKDIKVGLTGAFLSTQIFGTIINNSEGGSIVNISSDLGLIAPKQSLYIQKGKSIDEQPVKPVSYSVIKSGLIGLTKYTSTYWPSKVRCNCLCPGGIFNNQSEDFLEKVYSEIPMGRLADVNEYAGALVYLLSQSSSYLNDSVISIDGGRTAW